MVHLVDSRRSVDDVGAALPAAAARHGFGILGSQDLRGNLTAKGLDYPRACRVFDVCHPAQAKRALESDVRIAAMLPCRIAVYEEGAGTRLAALSPVSLAGLFDSPGLWDLAAQVDPAILSIMRDAAAGSS